MDDMAAFERQVHEALAAIEPFAAVSSLVVERRRQGNPREDLYEALTAVMLRLRQAGRDTDEDIVLDVMDRLVGWCSPHTRIE